MTESYEYEDSRPASPHDAVEDSCQYNWVDDVERVVLSSQMQPLSDVVVSVLNIDHYGGQRMSILDVDHELEGASKSLRAKGSAGEAPREAKWRLNYNSAINTLTLAYPSLTALVRSQLEAFGCMVKKDSTEISRGAVSGATLVTATMFDESPQGPDAAQTESAQSLDYTDPHTDDSDATRGVAEHGADADEGPQDGLRGTSEDSDGRQYGDTGQEGLVNTRDVPAQPESHFESPSQNESSG
ncbi:uncharacterized protein B0H18DRAFT_956815 [Fomitopsis serialis]|uniref:uncharacterized protein n=1 Tax=Fomitopsis serialis TaxID=139415 RepID=UPI0020080B10|nr:uncharacterized protein B0H18DRAFT_956815 [Neoantrodia serialis]KAH9921064.1 hypothetical protein B0H18DRAFT_956815 [Neoantrodia serialis]